MKCSDTSPFLIVLICKPLIAGVLEVPSRIFTRSLSAWTQGIRKIPMKLALIRFILLSSTKITALRRRVVNPERLRKLMAEREGFEPSIGD